MPNTASTYKRFFAFHLDGFFVFFLWTPVWIQIVGSLVKTGEMHVSWKWLLISFALQFFYKVVFLKFAGATLGKLIMGLKVIPKYAEGQDLGWSQSLIRVLADHLGFFFSFATYALAFIRHDRTHLSDWLAETRVVQKNPRKKNTKRRWLLAIGLVVYFLISGFYSSYFLIQNLSWTTQGVSLNKNYFHH
jgi:uncharacterized RDD family membrane protein YckC